MLENKKRTDKRFMTLLGCMHLDVACMQPINVINRLSVLDEGCITSRYYDNSIININLGCYASLVMLSFGLHEYLNTYPLHMWYAYDVYGHVTGAALPSRSISLKQTNTWYYAKN